MGGVHEEWISAVVVVRILIVIVVVFIVVEVVPRSPPVPRNPLKDPPKNTSWARKCHTRPWRIVALTRVCVGNFPNTLFENGTVLALRKMNSDFLAPSQAQISGS